MPFSDNGHSCLSLRIGHCLRILHTARSSLVLCFKASLLSKLPGSSTACQRRHWGGTGPSLCHRRKVHLEKRVHRTTNQGTWVPAPALPGHCVSALEKLPAPRHLSIFQIEEGVPFNSLYGTSGLKKICVPTTKRLYSNTGDKSQCSVRQHLGIPLYAPNSPVRLAVLLPLEMRTLRPSPKHTPCEKT